MFRQTLPGTKLDNSNGKVRVVYLEVVGNTPHDYKMDILLLQLPGNGPAGPSEPALLIIHHDDHLTVAREDFSLVVT